MSGPMKRVTFGWQSTADDPYILIYAHYTLKLGNWSSSSQFLQKFSSCFTLVACPMRWLSGTAKRVSFCRYWRTVRERLSRQQVKLRKGMGNCGLGVFWCLSLQFTTWLEVKESFFFPDKELCLLLLILEAAPVASTSPTKKPQKSSSFPLIYPLQKIRNVEDLDYNVIWDHFDIYWYMFYLWTDHVSIYIYKLFCFHGPTYMVILFSCLQHSQVIWKTHF